MASATSRSCTIFDNTERAGMERLVAAPRHDMELLGEQALEGSLAPISEPLQSPRALVAHGILPVLSVVAQDHG